MPELVFLPETRPLVEKVASWLAESAPGRPLDLRAVAVAVPTAGASRRLRGELVRLAGERGGGLLPPLLAAPMVLLERAGTAQPATRADRLLAWTDVLRRAPQDQFPGLLEGFSDHRKPATTLRIAQSLVEVCTLLAEGGWTPSSPQVAEAAPEDGRWQEFDALYRRYTARLARAGRTDPDETRIAAAAAGTPPPGIRHIVVAGVPDLNRLTQRFLENAEARGVRVTVLVDAPDCEDARFDGWGRPDPAHWSARPLSLHPDHIHVLADPASEAEAAARLLGGSALCVADAALLPFHERALRGAGREPFNPAGKSLRHFECGAIAEGWTAFCRSQDLGDLRALMERPVFLEALCAETRLSPSAALAAIDAIRTGGLVGFLPDALARWKTGRKAALVIGVEKLREKFDVARSLEKLPAFLGSLHAATRPTPASAAALQALAETLSSVLESPVGAGSAELLGAELEATTVYGRHEGDTVELNGWLEAPWLPHSGLVLSGVTEGALPAAVTGHPFLPDQLRARLGLQTNAQRFARDAYLLHTVLAARPPGHVQVTLSRTGAEGDPLRPSRLLFRCPDGELRDRVRKLLGPVPSLRSAPRRERLWQLEVPPKPPPEKLRVTAFGEYLACPFRFYLGRILRMESFDPEKAEMDAADFGTVLHLVVEHFATGPLRDSRDGGEIERFVLEDLDRVLAERFGDRLSLPVRVQKESLRARLRQFARLQAQSRREGWRLVAAETEWKAGETLSFAGLPLTAKIDRIEIHEKTGERRILDYKTYKTVRKNTPPETHMGPADGEFPEAEFIWDGRPRRWRQLQLPLYRAIAMRQWPDDPAPPRVGYFLLPEKLEESTILEFEVDGPLFESALRCAEAVADRIRRGVFWPPRDVRYDDFGEMFPDGNIPEALPESVKTFLAGS
jgi:ATP-dependent nuclease, subunit B